MFRHVLVLVIALNAAALLFWFEPSARVLACSILRIQDDPYERVLTPNLPELVLVGFVTKEEVTHDIPPPASSSSSESEKLYSSTVLPLAVLRGGLPDGDLVFRHLNGIDADCSGGPRLRVGEKVLLFLSQRGSEWQIRLSGGKVLLTDLGAAQVEEVGEAPVTIGRAEEILHQVGALSGAAQSQVDAAIAASAQSVNLDDAFKWRRGLFILVGALVAFGAGYLTVRRSKAPDGR